MSPGFHQKYPDREGRDMENWPEGFEREEIGNPRRPKS
jgi:hypothetical protein